MLIILYIHFHWRHIWSSKYLRDPVSVELQFWNRYNIWQVCRCVLDGPSSVCVWRIIPFRNRLQYSLCLYFIKSVDLIITLCVTSLISSTHSWQDKKSWHITFRSILLQLLCLSEECNHLPCNLIPQGGCSSCRQRSQRFVQRVRQTVFKNWVWVQKLLVRVIQRSLLIFNWSCRLLYIPVNNMPLS